MIKKYGKITEVIVVIVLGFICIKAVQINNAKKDIDNLYSGETSMTLSQTGLNMDQYRQVIEEIDALQGVTVSNTYLEENGERQNTLFIDKIYQDKYMNNLEIEGANFSDKDFSIEFDDKIVIPALVSKEYATENNLEIGEETSIENFLPNACELYSDETSMIASADGTSILNNETANKDQCQSTNKYSYLENENGFDEIPIKVIGIFDESSYSFPGFPSEYFPQIQVVVPSFIANDANKSKYDLSAYKNGDLTITKSQVEVFVDYSQITDSDLNEQIGKIESEIGTSLMLERSTDWQKFGIEDTIKIYNQALVNYIFIGIVVGILWIIQWYYRLQYFKYDYAVLSLLGANTKTIIRRQIRNELSIILFNSAIVVVVGILVNAVWLFIICYVLIWILECISYVVLCKKLELVSNEGKLLEGEI